MKKIILTLLLIIVVKVSLLAAVFAKTGTASLQFLKLGVDARAIGMGEAYTATTDDISSVYWNPAGLTNYYQKQTFISHTNWVAETYHEFVATSTSTDYGFFAVFASVFHTPDMEETDEVTFGPTGRKFSYSNLAFGLTYANEFTDRFSFGVSGKYLRENIADESVNGMSVDLGSRYKTGYRNIIIGMALRNFGPGTQYKLDNNKIIVDNDPWEMFDNSGTEFQLPMNFSLGMVGDIFRTNNSYLITAAQIDNCVDRQETWNLGAEYNYHLLFLRCGYQIGYDAASYSAGFGVQVVTRLAVFNIDYAYTDMGRLQEDMISGAHRISLKLRY